jgi:Flp pilus assembly pilin Flp
LWVTELIVEARAAVAMPAKSTGEAHSASPATAAAAGGSGGSAQVAPVEYGLMVALIAIVIIVAVSLLGSNNLSSLFNNVASSV